MNGLLGLLEKGRKWNMRDPAELIQPWEADVRKLPHEMTAFDKFMDWSKRGGSEKMMEMGRGLMEGDDYGQPDERMAEIMNTMNMIRSKRPAIDMAGQIGQAQSYGSYADGPAAQGRGQPWTPRVAPRFAQPMARAGDRSYGGVMRGRRNVL